MEDKIFKPQRATVSAREFYDLEEILRKAIKCETSYGGGLEKISRDVSFEETKIIYTRFPGIIYVKDRDGDGFIKIKLTLEKPEKFLGIKVKETIEGDSVEELIKKLKTTKSLPEEYKLAIEKAISESP